MYRNRLLYSAIWSSASGMLWTIPPNFQRNFSTGEVEVEGSTIYHKTEYRERRNHYALFTVNTPIDGFDTSRDAFLGAWHSNANPEVVENGRCTNSVAHGWAPVGVHQVNVTLQPGESRSLIFCFGLYRKPGGREVGRARRHQ